MRLFACIISIWGAFSAATYTTAQWGSVAPRKVVHFGHSFSQTTETLPSGRWTLGTWVLGYGLSDYITVATSPWFWAFYNMYNGVLRVRVPLFSGHSLGVQAAYFRTYPKNYFLTRKKPYKMQGHWVSVSYGVEFSPRYTLTASVNHGYFKEGFKSFSLNLASLGSRNSQISVGTLHEFALTPWWTLSIELAVLGLDLEPYFYHGGASFSVELWERLFVQLGSSYTKPFKEGFVNKDNLYILPNSYSIHPEIMLQYYF